MFSGLTNLTNIITPKVFDTDGLFVTEFNDYFSTWYDIYGNQPNNNVKPRMIYTKSKNDINNYLTKLNFSTNNRCYFQLDNNVLTIYPTTHKNIGYTLTELKTAIENDIPNITKVIIKGPN